MDKYIGKKLDGRYEILELVGFGGMAVVFKAYDLLENRHVAVKILKDEYLHNEEFRRRFRNESKAIAMLSHPNIVRVFDVNFSDTVQYIVMEYIDGITLKEYIGQQGAVNGRRRFISPYRFCAPYSMRMITELCTATSSRRTSCFCRTAPSRSWISALRGLRGKTAELLRTKRSAPCTISVRSRRAANRPTSARISIPSA